MRHKTIPLLLFATTSILFSACLKDSEEIAQDAGILPSGCGADGVRIQATVNGSSYCASAQVHAVGDGQSVIITGVGLTGTTLVLQIDSVALGTQAMTEAANGILYMETGTSYTVLPGTPGSLNITQLDTAAHTIKASFDATVHNEMSGSSRTISGNVDVQWTESE